MRRKPRSLFKARARGPGVVYVGPEFVGGPEPHYLPLLDELYRRHGGALKPGEVSYTVVAHDAGCAQFAGGPCDCAPTASLVDGATWRALSGGGGPP